jgi:UPF0755 protein
MTSRGCLRFILAFLLLTICLAAAVGIFLWRDLLTPYQGFSNQVLVEYEHGTSVRDLGEQLEREGVIRSRYSLMLWRAFHPRASLQAGEYLFDKPLSPGEVFEKIRHGQTYYEVLTIPEGSNIFDIAEAVRSLRFIKPEAFLKAASDPAVIYDLDPHAPSLEGYLFPSSYRVSRKTTASDLCKTMVDQFRKEWAKLNPPPGVDIHKVVTLASLVEKEASAPEERPLIAAVFENRLAQAMPLQCDPTVVYAALKANKYRGTIYRSDLASTDPYNTYTHIGLPPGPIANPGVASLTAALHPANSAYLYFVAKPGEIGHHAFSETLAQHEEAVRQYRQPMHQQ